ncbi:hypothetical protein JX265_003823 [Neoarthrinium moseri]|uniref:AAA+ ATPase domain-containing protein n=1 Tax=Neoarthrinium moseri TaxID=1658444 RepID=A0A9P9WSK8_9PEZI|nr:hypothetical protein JX265_003823 [Neoarthrinium moseri]
MSDSEPFTFIAEERAGEAPRLFEGFLDRSSARIPQPDVPLVTELRNQYPELIVTTIPVDNVNLLEFAAAGFAQAELDSDDEPLVRWRGFAPPAQRHGRGQLAEARFFAKYRYKWNNENFILYTVILGLTALQYVLKEPHGDETTSGNSTITDSLIRAIGEWSMTDEELIYVFDNGFWSASKGLWEQVQKASWDKVILDPKTKKELTQVSGKFFDGREVYEEYGVPWKRGLIFHGPVGNGKTISIKALMHTLYQRDPKVPCLYVKSAPYTYNLRGVFQFARMMAPCLLILEDIETIVTASTRSYFFNEVDGLENNDGILMIATTNYLDRLDPGLSKRPSRFDRKYLFPLPNLDERVLYCEYWYGKLKSKPAIDFPRLLCRPIADLMDDFSFAYMQEAFVATLLVLARDQEDDEFQTSVYNRGTRDEEQYEFYRVMKAQVKTLRDEMGAPEASPEMFTVPPTPGSNANAFGGAFSIATPGRAGNFAVGSGTIQGSGVSDQSGNGRRTAFLQQGIDGDGMSFSASFALRRSFPVRM